MAREWGFEEDSQDVDLDRLHSELMSIPAAFARAYIQELKKNAPVVFSRYRDYCKGKFTGCLKIE